MIALIDLFLVTGNVGRRGAGVNPLRGQNNVQGAAHMGCEPRSLTGAATLEQGRERFEQVWKAPLPTRRGLDLTEMLDAASRGTFKALYAIGYDVLFTHPDTARTREALAKLELLVVQDLFENDTAKELAHVLLPAASVFEKDGTFMNGERRVQRVRRSVAPRGSSRADWEIVCDVARAMGKGDGFSFASASEIWDEVRAVWPKGAGISYARLEAGGLQWPCPDESHPGTEVLHGTDFALGHRTTLRCVAPARSAENVSEAYPFLLVTGRHLQQFNAGTMTGRTGQDVLRPHDLLEIGADDAALLGLVDGDVAAVESAHGEARLPVQVRDGLRPGELFATFHERSSHVNRLTGTGLDPITHTPEYKRTAGPSASRRRVIAHGCTAAAERPRTSTSTITKTRTGTLHAYAHAQAHDYGAAGRGLRCLPGASEAPLRSRAPARARGRPRACARVRQRPRLAYSTLGAIRSGERRHHLGRP